MFPGSLCLFGGAIQIFQKGFDPKWRRQLCGSRCTAWWCANAGIQGCTLPLPGQSMGQGRLPSSPRSLWGPLLSSLEQQFLIFGGGGHYVENPMQVINIFLRKIQIFTQYFGSSSMGATDPRAWPSLRSSGPFLTPRVLYNRLWKPLFWVWGVSFLFCGELLKLEYQVLDFWLLITVTVRFCVLMQQKYLRLFSSASFYHRVGIVDFFPCP